MLGKYSALLQSVLEKAQLNKYARKQTTIRRTDMRVGTDEMQAASAWILVKTLAEMKPCIQ